MRFNLILRHGIAVAIACLVTTAAQATDNLKLAVGAPGTGDTCVAEGGKRAGICEK